MQKYNFDDLCEVMDKLLSEDGCPWDKVQTHETLKEPLLEECYEAIDAINQNDPQAMAEEFGDVLLQVVFHGKLGEAEGLFTVEDITDGITRKMIHRHRHIFGGDKADTPEEVMTNWEKIKKEEKGFETITETLRAVPKVFPALLRAQKVQKKVSKVLDYSNMQENFERAGKQLQALQNATKENNSQNSDEILEKYGELLFSLVNVSQYLKINPEFALTNAIETFINRFENIENMSLSKGCTLEGILKI